MLLERRRFLKVLVGLVAAPVIVRAASLMPVKKLLKPTYYEFSWEPGLVRFDQPLPKGYTLTIQTFWDDQEVKTPPEIIITKDVEQQLLASLDRVTDKMIKEVLYGGPVGGSMEASQCLT